MSDKTKPVCVYGTNGPDPDSPYVIEMFRKGKWKPFTSFATLGLAQRWFSGSDFPADRLRTRIVYTSRQVWTVTYVDVPPKEST